MSDHKHTILGQPAELPASPEEARLDAVPNPQRDVNYVTRFTAPEFTSLCPVTGQPDFAHLVIDYVPDEFIVESKSLKLFLGAFRNSNDFYLVSMVEGSRPVRYERAWVALSIFVALIAPIVLERARP